MPKCVPGCECGRHGQRIEGKKRCPKCGEWKALEDFSQKFPSASTSLHSYCKTCHYDEARARRLRQLFNITIEEYDRILAHQGGVCAICENPPKKDGKRLAVDHDHKTGQVRGLLCWGCNAALGKFRDNAKRVKRAARYIEHPPASAALGRDVFGRTGSVKKKRPRRKKA